MNVLSPDRRGARLPRRRRLLHPRAQGPVVARDRPPGNLIGAAGAVLACVVVFLAEDLDHVVADPGRHRGRRGPRRARRASGRDDADAAAGRAVQRRRRRSGRPGRRPRADRRPRRGAPRRRRPQRSPCSSGRSRSPARCVTFAKLQELMTTRPVVFPGGPVADGRRDAARCRSRRRCRRRRPRRRRLAVAARAARPWWRCSSVCCSCCRSAAPTYPIVISLLNAFTGLTVAASGYVLDNVLLLVAGTLVGASGTILTRMMASAMGRSTASASCSARSRAARRPARPRSATGRCARRAPRTSRSCSATPARSSSCPGYGLAVAQAQHTIHELVDVLEAQGHRGRLRHPPRRRPDAGTHERAARRGERALRAAQGDGRGQLRAAVHRRRAGGRRQRRGEPGREDQPGQPDLRHADPHRR